MRNHILTLLLMAIPLSCIANLYSIKTLDIAQGLSNNHVVSITQDKLGFLWFATEDGLNKFDGKRFKNYYKFNCDLSGNELNCVYADPVDSILWIATQRNGLNAYNYSNDEFTVYKYDRENPKGLITNDVTHITSSANGNLWISTYYRGIEYFDKKTGYFEHYNTTTIPTLPSNAIWTVTDTNDGYLYIGHEKYGLSVLSLKTREVKNYCYDANNEYTLPGNHVKCIYKDKAGNIWVGTNKGLAIFNREKNSFIRIKDNNGNIINSLIYEIKEFNNNKLWITTELDGVYIVDLNQNMFLLPGRVEMTHLTEGSTSYSLSNSTVRSIFQDSFQNIWLGTYGGGVNFIRNSPPLFDLYTYSAIANDERSLNAKIVTNICVDNNDRLWFGTDGGGIDIFEKGERLYVYNTENRNLNSNNSLSSYKDSNNNLWFGFFNGSINYYSDKEKRITPIYPNAHHDLDVRCFYEDKQANMWIGTNIGIFITNINDRGNFKHYHCNNSDLHEDLIRSIYKDGQGRLWIGTFGQGLGVFDKNMKLIKQFAEHTQFCSNTINHIFSDSQQRVWVATGDGLICFDDPNNFDYVVYGRDSGVDNTHIRAISEDRHGNIWFSTNAGIGCFINESGNFLFYNRYENNPMGSFSAGATCTDKNGKIYFGSINGVCFFDPERVLDKQSIPPVLITELQLFEDLSTTRNIKSINLSIRKHKEICLNYNQNTFSIIFNIQDYSLVNQIDYIYCLKGLDDVWYTTNSNELMFHNIPPGNYIFLIKARTLNGEWSASPQTLHIKITPPWWLSMVAKILYLFVVISGLLALLYAYKKRVELKSSLEMELKNRACEQELNEERLRFYTNITHEIRTPLTLIIGPLEDLQTDKELNTHQQKKLFIIHQSASRLLNLINQILEFRKTETQNKKLSIQKGNISELVKEVSLKYKELNQNRLLDFSINVESENMPLYFDREVMTIIIDNIISNAFKYTEKGFIEVSLYTTNEDGISYTVITVSDSGFGIHPNDISNIFDRYYQSKNEYHGTGTGIGLALVKNLVELHEADIKIKSSLGAGSRFCVRFVTDNIYPNALHEDSEKDLEESICVESIEYLDVHEEDHKPLLLVVEDNIDIRTYIEESFANIFKILAAGNGEDGLKIARKYLPDIILSDIMMPKMDGITFCKEIKNNVTTSHIPFILLTAKSTLPDKEEGYIVGADSYLSKPFSASLLRSRINNLLESRRKIAKQIIANMSLDNKSTFMDESINKLDNEFIERVTQVIEDNLNSTKIDVSYLAEKMCMSSSTLYRKMKALTGISTKDYIQKIKMRSAEQLLLEGKYTISEIAYMTGANSAAYFRLCFKEEFNVSPTEYIKKIKNRGSKSTL